MSTLFRPSLWSRFTILVVITALGLFLFREKLSFDPITYAAHFADERTVLGIPNFGNVITNFGFLFVGIYGLRNLNRVPKELRFSATIFLAALVGTAFGSSYFHWETTPTRLFWDQVPMSVGFGSFVGMVIADRVALKFGRIVGVILSMLGPITVWNIYYGGGSTVPYISLQFGALFFSAMLLLFIPGGKLKKGPIFLGIVFYIFAKIFEAHDFQIFAALGDSVSGHSLKHLAAALALVILFRGMAVTPSRAL